MGHGGHVESQLVFTKGKRVAFADDNDVFFVDVVELVEQREGLFVAYERNIGIIATNQRNGRRMIRLDVMDDIVIQRAVAEGSAHFGHEVIRLMRIHRIEQGSFFILCQIGIVGNAFW